MDQADLGAAVHLWRHRALAIHHPVDRDAVGPYAGRPHGHAGRSAQPAEFQTQFRGGDGGPPLKLYRSRGWYEARTLVGWKLLGTRIRGSHEDNRRTRNYGLVWWVDCLGGRHRRWFRLLRLRC